MKRGMKKQGGNRDQGTGNRNGPRPPTPGSRFPDPVLSAAFEPICGALFTADFALTAETTEPTPPDAKNAPPSGSGATLDVKDVAGDKTKGGTPDGKKPPIPKFALTAYSGGPMQLAGYRYPVVIDLAGLKAAKPKLPIYISHEEDVGNLLGETDELSVVDGCMKATGRITCGQASEACNQAMEHARNGFSWQASVNALPREIEFIPEEVSALVNGKTVAGPCTVARAATLTHIALVPLGADTSTTASIAASAAKEPVMEFTAWLKAQYDLDAAGLTEAQTTKFKAEFDKVGKAPAKPAEDPAKKPIVAAAKKDGADGEGGDEIAAMNARYAANVKRIAKIEEIAKDHLEIQAKAIEEGWSADKTELEVMRASRKPESSGAPAIHASGMVPKDGWQNAQTLPIAGGGRIVATGARLPDNMAIVLETAVLLSAGYSAERLAKNPSYGPRVVEAAEKFMRSPFGSRSIGPKTFFRMAGRFGGVELPEDAGVPAFETTLRAEFSTLSVPWILSNVMNKFILDAYNSVDPNYANPNEVGPAWQNFVKRAPVKDFKPQYFLRLVDDLEFKPLGQSGEIQHGKLDEQKYMLQADTRAIMFSLTRKDIINDDQSAFSTLPTHFGLGAGRTVAKAIYAALKRNLDSNGNLFFAAHAADGQPTAGNYITGAAAAWYLLAAATEFAYPIAAGFLNGQEMPIVERNEMDFSQLGISFRGFNDFGVSLQEYRAAVKSQVALDMGPLETAVTAFITMVQPLNKQPTGIRPAVLLVPPAYRGVANVLYTAQQLLQTLATTGSASRATLTPADNPYKGLYRPVCSAMLDNAYVANPVE